MSAISVSEMEQRHSLNDKETQKKKGWHALPAFRVETMREGPKKL
jgi:hypothetical protein